MKIAEGDTFCNVM